MNRSLVFVLALAACGGAAQTQTQSVSLPTPQPSASIASVALPIAPSELDAPVPIATSDAAWGDRAAPVTIVEFADFQCPYCAKAASTIELIEQDYGPHKLRVVFKHMPLKFHPEARPCADAAATVLGLGGNDAFWTFYTLAFHNQTQLGADSYYAWAKQAGVDARAFHDALTSNRFKSWVDDDLDAAEKVGVNGTPAFFVNGISLSGAQPEEKFKAVIDAELAASAARRDQGVKALDNYVVATKANFTKPVDEDEEPDDVTTYKVPVGTSPALGPSTALVTIVEFSDFQCPYCKKVEPTLQQVRAAYGNDVRIVFKHEPLPFHPRAEPAAEVALEALAEKGNAGFWAAHDALFASQPALDDPDLEKVATDLKLDLAKVRSAIATHKYKRALDDDADVADDFKASGTPHFFINGQRLVGAQPLAKFKQIIDDKLAKARALVAAGTKPESVYAEVTKDGKGPPGPQSLTFTTNAPTKGPAGARVTIVEFSDFQCPFCKRAEDTLADVLKAYPTQVRIQWRHFPLRQYHAQAELAAEASVEAYKQRGNDAFWKLHDALYAHQGDPDGLERAKIEGYAQGVGVDVSRLRAALDTASHASAVDADMKVAQANDVSGTPSFFVGAGVPTAGVAWSGYPLQGAQPLSKFRRAIDKALGAHP